ncbi:MAG: DUF4332 domain-containing protein [Candidatus Thorarchaeota archaeon]
MKIIEIIGIDKKHATLLEKEGYHNVEDLLPLTKSQIKKLAKKIGVSVAVLDTWQEHADLMRIDGVNPQIANALNLIGIDSVKEFARRNVKSIVSKLRDLKKEDSNLLSKIPSETEVEKWIGNAKTLSGVPEKKKPRDNEIPVPVDLIEIIPFGGDYGEFGPEYWNNKWEKAPIIYTGRALRGEHYKKEIDIDVKVFIKQNDEILHHVISQLGLRKDTANNTALACQRFVCDFLKYKYDDLTAEVPEFWLFPFESIQSEIGDCEDGAILIASLMINAGIPSWRVKVCAAQVMSDPVVVPSEEELGGHAYAIYLADRPDSERNLEWVILDWCYLQDPEVDIGDKPLARDGGQEGAYKSIWFTFNDEHSWAQSGFEVKEGRISKDRKTKQDEVLAPLGDILKHLADEELKKVFKKYNIEID